MIKDFRDFIGVGIAGILSILWFDLRSLRKNRETFKQDLAKTYLTEKTHGLLCENTSLQFTKQLLEMKEEIITAIKDNSK